MEKIQYEYMRYNKYMMKTIGQWPEQDIFERFLITVVFAPLSSLQAVLQGGSFITAIMCSDIEVLMEVFAPFTISLMVLSKYANFIFYFSEMKYLYDVMLADFSVYSKVSSDFDVLCKHYQTAKSVTIYYAASLYGTMIAYLLVPTMAAAADAIGLYNMTGDPLLAFRVDHLLDARKYHYLLLGHSYIGTIGLVTIVVGVDCMTIFYIQHECGLCEILGRRLTEFAGDSNGDVELHPIEEEDQAYRNARECVLLHKHILRYSKTIEDANTMMNLFQLGLNMVGTSFTLYQSVLQKEHPNIALKYIMFTITLLSVILLGTWPGQQLTDYSAQIFEYTTSGKWYTTSMRARKLLNIMLLRSLAPIKLTAGRLYVLNLENFSAVVRTSFSYFTVLCSVQ